MGTPRLGLNREKCLLKTYLSRDQILVEGSQDLERLSIQEGIQRGHRLHREEGGRKCQAGLRSVPRALGGNGGARCLFQSWLRVEGMEAKAAVLSCSGSYKMSKRIPRCGHRRDGVRRQSSSSYIQQPLCSQQIHNNSNVPIMEVGLHSVL